MLNSIPYEISLIIASSLQAWDVCSLGSCSRFWRELCGSDCLWESLYTERWPAFCPPIKVHQKDWRAYYIDMHKEMEISTKMVVDFLEKCTSNESIEVGHHLAAINCMSMLELGFQDVRMLLFKPKLSVLVNFIGLHYCITWLGVPTAYIWEALDSCKISEREVCVRCWNPGETFAGLPFGLKVFEFSLSDILLGNVENVLGLLHRDAIRNLIRVQISVAKPEAALRSGPIPSIPSAS